MHQLDHFVREDPTIKKAEETQAYEIEDGPSTSREGKAKDVLQSTLSIKGIPAKVLFDTGASRSFISDKKVA